MKTILTYFKVLIVFLVIISIYILAYENAALKEVDEMRKSSIIELYHDNAKKDSIIRVLKKDINYLRNKYN